MKNNISAKRIILLSFILVSFSLARAGWIFTGKYIDADGKTIMQRIFIQDNYVKVEQYNLIYTINLNTGALILVDPENLVYYQGTMEGYILGLRKLKNKQLEKLLIEIPMEQQPEYKRLYLGQIAAIGQKVIPVTDSVRYTLQPDTLKIGGYRTEKYLVTLNGRKMEETWIAPGLDIKKEFDWTKFLQYESILVPENKTIKYMITGSFNQLLERGYPLRRIIIQGGYRTEYQVNRIDAQKVPDYEFFTPALCREVTLEKWIDRNTATEPKYDDYE